MGRAKLPRKSTNIDMTAMCDVAFLLLSFFILTTKFKPAEAIAVTTPSSVASKIAPSKDFVLITIDKDGKVFLTIDDEQKREVVANTLNTTRNLGINVPAFKKAGFIGASFSGLNSFLAIAEENNLDLKARKLAVEIAQNNIDLAETGHYPTVGLTAKAGLSDSNRTPQTDSNSQ